MKNKTNPDILGQQNVKKIFLIMKISFLLIMFSVINVYATSIFSQNATVSVHMQNVTVREVVGEIEKQGGISFLFNDNLAELNRQVSVSFTDQPLKDVLESALSQADMTYEEIQDNFVVLLSKPDHLKQQEITVTGRVTDVDGTPIPGASIIIRGTARGTTTNVEGAFSLQDVPPGSVLVISFIGMISEEILIEDQKVINIILREDTFELEEVIAIGYGTMRRSDLTGSVVRADIASFRESPNVSIMQSLQGTIPGLTVGQTVQAGQEAEMLIRGRSSLSGELAPLIVLDGVIFRGNLIDLNPNDIESIDVLKDASSAAIYGSQATNGVILITTTRSGGVDGKPTIKYSSYYAVQDPIRTFRPGPPADYNLKNEHSDILLSRTEESGYLEPNPEWSVSWTFATSEEVDAYNQGRTYDWYNALTNDNMYIQNHDLSIANSTEATNYLISVGYTDNSGYMLNENYNRMNARINIDNSITDWLKIGVQSFMTLSDYSGQEISVENRYLGPYQTPHDERGNLYRVVSGNVINPYLEIESDHLDKRSNLFGNLYATIDIPYIQGLSYRINLANNYRVGNFNYFRSYEHNFEGKGLKEVNFFNDFSADNVLSYKRVFNGIHSIDATLVYGLEKRNFNFTRSIASSFIAQELGYNYLQAGNAELQEALSGAWEEASLYNMVRFFYGFNNKYLITGTVRRDGFSGFSEEHKFGIFPSISVAWVASEEAFLSDNTWLEYLKIRGSYGSVGNRTIGRYQTLARISGGYNYITSQKTPVYTHSISSLASPNLKWETTTGINVGFDFGIPQRFSGSIDYYNNNTTDLLYEVDIPGITRFEKFPDNLGKLNNQGLEMNISSINLKRSDFEWRSTFNFTRNRNTLKELLGFDLDGDGKEDDLISEGLFIGESIDAIYDYKIDGMWQVNDEIPAGFDLGSYKIVDLNNDEVFDANDKTIIGYRDPSYSFGIINNFRYKNWSASFFIHSIQGGRNYYMAEDEIFGFGTANSQMHFRRHFPAGLDYWTPENPNARYQRINRSTSTGLEGKRFTQRNFVRLQDISVSYNLSSNLIQRIGVQNLRLYVSGKNLVTLTQWPGWDPETGHPIHRNLRPVMKSYSIGLNVEL